MKVHGPYSIIEQDRFRSACAFVQSVQSIVYLDILSAGLQNFLIFVNFVHVWVLVCINSSQILEDCIWLTYFEMLIVPHALHCVDSCIFSSPEHKVLMVSYCDQSLSVICRPCIVNSLLQTTSPPKWLDGFWNNFTGRFLGWPFTKIAQTVSLRWTKWPPELKIEKPLNDFFSWTRRWILK